MATKKVPELMLAWLLLLMTALVSKVLSESGAGPTILACGQQCFCGAQQRGLLKEHRIICNQTGSQPVALTEGIFPNGTDGILATYVRVEDTEQVTITRDFLDKWKMYYSCSLDIWRAKRLIFPHILSEDAASNSWPTFAGIGIVESNVDIMPDGLFPRKEKVGLRLFKSSVGLIQPRLFKNAKKLNYFLVQDSYIGIIQGSQQSNELQVKKDPGKSTIVFNNTVVGRVEPRALLLTSNSLDVVQMQNVTVGQIATNGIVLSNLKLVVNNSKVGDLQQGALNVGERATITVTNSHIIAQPEALTHLPCSFNENHIYSNDILIPVRDSSEGSLEVPDRELEGNETSKNLTSPPQKQQDIAELTSERLKLVLHPTCVQYNLPSTLRNYGCEITEVIQAPAEQQKSSNFLQTGLYSFVAISALALILVVVLACLLSSSRNRRDRVTTESPVIVMSALPQDPIYDEPSSLFLNGPPPLPPPVSVSCKSETPAFNHCSAGSSSTNCASATLRHERVDNDYVCMK